MKRPTNYSLGMFCIAVLGTLALSVAVVDTYKKRTKATADLLARADTACPSLLSISRSARDTLIVMKAEPLCINFVLNNLK